MSKDKDDLVSTKRIYTDLDSLFDTEITYLGIIDSRLTREYLSDEYGVDNNYLYLNQRVFMEMFKDRDNRILANSKATSVIDMIKGIIYDIDLKRKDGRFTNTKIELTINTYPYTLSDTEIEDMKTFYKKYLVFVDNIEIIHKKEISKAFVNKLIVIISRYGLNWFMDMKIKYLDFRCPHLRLIIPDRYYDHAYIRKLGVDSEKMINHLQSILMTDVRLDVIEKETFMIKIDASDDEFNITA